MRPIEEPKKNNANHRKFNLKKPGLVCRKNGRKDHEYVLMIPDFMISIHTSRGKKVPWKTPEEYYKYEDERRIKEEESKKIRISTGLSYRSWHSCLRYWRCDHCDKREWDTEDKPKKKIRHHLKSLNGNN